MGVFVFFPFSWQGRVIMEEFRSELEHEKKLLIVCEDSDSSAEDSSKLHASFAETYEETISQVVDAFERLGLLNKGHLSPEPSIHLLTGNIPSWKVSFDSCLEALQLNLIYDALGRTIIAAVWFSHPCSSCFMDLLNIFSEEL